MGENYGSLIQWNAIWLWKDTDRSTAVFYMEKCPLFS